MIRVAGERRASPPAHEDEQAARGHPDADGPGHHEIQVRHDRRSGDGGHVLAPDVLLAYQPVGPNVERFIRLVQTFPATTFSALVDDEGTIRTLSDAAVQAGVTLNLFLDLDCGMHRSGMPPGPRAAALYRSITSLPGLEPAGLHMYDGHIHDTDLAVRTRVCEEAFGTIPNRCARTCHGGIAGAGVGHRRHADVPPSRAAPRSWNAVRGQRCSGTGVTAPCFPTWISFRPILVLTRVVSKPGANLLCLDLGHKAVASEGTASSRAVAGAPRHPGRRP